MNGGSGGTGIGFLPPNADAISIRSGLDELVADAEKKYAGNFKQTIFPFRLFEFARSSGYRLDDGDHLWDVRLHCLIWPDRIVVEPCILRLCPAPFDGLTYSREAVVNNLSG
jgi:hypothetical protein